MRMLVAAAKRRGDRFRSDQFAHMGRPGHTGRLALDYAEFLLAEATLAVPTHTNASLIDINQPAMRPELRLPKRFRVRLG